MSSRTFTITVVDSNPKPWPLSHELVAVGVPLKVAAEYDRIRREMSPAGLRRKIKLVRN